MFEFQSSNFLVECFKNVSSRENINFVKKNAKGQIYKELYLQSTEIKCLFVLSGVGMNLNSVWDGASLNSLSCRIQQGTVL